MLLVLREWIAFRPALHPEVGDNMQPSRLARFFSKPRDRFPDTGFMMSDAPVAHAVFRRACKRIEPDMHLGERSTKRILAFPAMFIE